MNQKTLTIDIGGTFIKTGLIDKKCQLSHTTKIPTPYKSQEDFLNTLQHIYHDYKKYGINGIAISAPGKIDVDQGILLTSGALTYLEGMHLIERLTPLCDGLPISVENDGKAAALCESWVGQGHDKKSCVVLLFGSGIGGGIVIDGKILRGSDLIAGEFSPVFSTMSNNNYQSMAGNYSTLSVVKQIRELKRNPQLNGEEMIQLYKNHDEDVKNILDDWFFAIAKFCYNIDCIINPDCICIGGGISSEPLFIQKIKENIDNIYEQAFVFRKPMIVPCLYHNDSNLIGAFYTFCQKYKREVLK